jgi:hypothetical protein
MSARRPDGGGHLPDPDVTACTVFASPVAGDAAVRNGTKHPELWIGTLQERNDRTIMEAARDVFVADPSAPIPGVHSRVSLICGVV